MIAGRSGARPNQAESPEAEVLLSWRGKSRTCATSEHERLEAGRVLVEAMAHVPHAWPDLRAAMAEVSEFLGDPTRIAFAALEDGRVRGWIGALRHSKFAWELHPLVVDPHISARVGVPACLKRWRKPPGRRA